MGVVRESRLSTERIGLPLVEIVGIELGRDLSALRASKGLSLAENGNGGTKF